jgi:uncharacterized Zn finger protein (UPF0148 family)
MQRLRDTSNCSLPAFTAESTLPGSTPISPTDEHRVPPLSRVNMSAFHMPFKDSVPPTGGKLTISARGYLEYSSQNKNRSALVELMAENGAAVDFAPFGGINLRSANLMPKVRVMVPSDAEGMFGRQCPECGGVFRATHLGTDLCPYCDHAAEALDFLTNAHKSFIETQYKAILEVQRTGRDVTIDFEERAETPAADDPWIVTERKNQTHLKCACRTEFDVLGEFVRCPSCGTPTARQVMDRRMADLRADFERDDASIPKDASNRAVRSRKWQSYVPICVSEFEAVARYMVRYLSAFPMTDRRRAQLQGVATHNLPAIDRIVRDIFDIELLRDFTDGDREFLLRMFARRHLFAHCGGVVDQEYLDRTRDSSVALHELVGVSSNEVARMIELTRRLAFSFVSGVESLG